MILGQEDKYEPVTKEKNFKMFEVIDYENDKYKPNFAQLFNAIMLAMKLELLRIIVGPITVNSWWRSVWWNKSKRVNGSSNSYHLDGLAADVKFDFTKWNKESMTRVLQFIGFTNVNFYWTSDCKTWVWIHVDIGKPWNDKEFNYRDLDANTQKEIKL